MLLLRYDAVRKNYQLSKRSVSSTTQNVNAISDVLINAGKKFVDELAQSYFSVPNGAIYMQKSIKDDHHSDSGSITYRTLGVTRTTCDNLGAFHQGCCSKIIVIEGLPKPVFRRTLIHELIHAELHERRMHPLQTKLQRSASQDQRFEEGICVLAEFLSVGLGLNPKAKHFTRSGVTDEYMDRFASKHLIDEFGREQRVQADSTKQNHEAKYSSGFAHALSSMVSNGFTYDELFNYYIKHGVFAPSRKARS